MTNELPQTFTDFMRALLGEARFSIFMRAMQDKPTTSVRLNPLKAPQIRLDVERSMNGFDGAVPWTPQEGAYLAERPPFTFDPVLHSGAYYVQDASSMFLRHALKGQLKQSVTALDLCAAPGGKATHLRSLLPKGSLLVANEVNRQRAAVLAQNLMRFGHADVAVTNSPADNFARLPDFFDLIVADVPCSGEGMFRKDEHAIAQWTPQLTAMCSRRQRDIIKAAWPALKPGGLLIYSTCTFNTSENDDNVKWIANELGADILPISVPPEWGILTTDCGLRFVPGLTRGEGLFLSLLQKNGSAASPVKQIRKSKNAPALAPKHWLLNPDDFTFEACGPTIYALRAELSEKVNQLRSAVNVLSAGIKLCQQKGNGFIPSHALALSADFRRNAFPEMDVSYDTALTYLCRKTFIAKNGTPKGFVTVIYQNLPLGFVKNLGTRVNNLYPLECKIRTSYLSNYNLYASS